MDIAASSWSSDDGVMMMMIYGHMSKQIGYLVIMVNGIGVADELFVDSVEGWFRGRKVGKKTRKRGGGGNLRIS